MPSFTPRALAAASAALVRSPDLGALLLGDGRVNVEHERVGVRDLGHDERNALRHQAGDEGNITRPAVELGPDNRALVGSRAAQHRCSVSVSRTNSSEADSNFPPEHRSGPGRDVGATEDECQSRYE